MHRILRAFQQARLNERFERLGNFFDVVSHKGRKLFARQERVRVPMQENEQIKIAGISQKRRLREKTRNFVRADVGWIRGRNKKPPPPRWLEAGMIPYIIVAPSNL